MEIGRVETTPPSFREREILTPIGKCPSARDDEEQSASSFADISPSPSPVPIKCFSLMDSGVVVVVDVERARE